MQPPSLITRIHNLDGTLRLNVAEPAYRRHDTTGYGGTIWRRNIEENGPYVGGSHEITPAVPAATRRVERISVRGTKGLPEADYWEQIDERILALDEAFSSSFLWAIATGGKLWTYRSIGPADVDATQLPNEDLIVGRRVVVVTFDVQPSPSVTAIGG